MAKIVVVPAPILRQVAKPVEKLDKKIVELIQDMHSTLLAAKNPEGVGLAAPQIGISLRIFLIRPNPKSDITTFINPTIVKYSQRTQKSTAKHGVYEGCLSIPNHYAPITRSASVVVSYQSLLNDQLVPTTQTFSAFPAHVIQHEMDHLNGILFIDRCLEQNTKLYKVDNKDWTEISL